MPHILTSYTCFWVAQTIQKTNRLKVWKCMCIYKAKSVLWPNASRCKAIYTSSWTMSFHCPSSWIVCSHCPSYWTVCPHCTSSWTVCSHCPSSWDSVFSLSQLLDRPYSDSIGINLEYFQEFVLVIPMTVQIIFGDTNNCTYHYTHHIHQLKVLFQTLLYAHVSVVNFGFIFNQIYTSTPFWTWCNELTNTPCQKKYF